MKTKYDELTLTHNLSGFIIPKDRYEHIYAKGLYSIPPFVALYNDTIGRDAMRTEFYQTEGNNEAKRNNRALCKAADTVCTNFIM